MKTRALLLSAFSLSCLNTFGVVQILDLSSLPTTPGFVVFPSGDSDADLHFQNSTTRGVIVNRGDTRIYGDLIGIDGRDSLAPAYQSGDVAFPSDIDGATAWLYDGILGGGYVIGQNWLPLKDTNERYGWMAFTLETLGAGRTEPIASFDWFIYDDTTTNTNNAIGLQAAQNAVGIPEPTSSFLVFLAAFSFIVKRNRQ